MYDVVIIGAGPAGSALARDIGRDQDVLLADRRRLDEPPSAGGPTKPCGGLIAPDAQRVFAAAGLGLPSEILAGPQLFAVRTIDLASGLTRHYQRHYINVNRELLDRWAVTTVPARVERAFGLALHSVKLAEGDAPTSIELRGPGGSTRRVQTKLLVGADGGSSRVRRECFGEHRMPRRYAAIQEWIPASRPEPFFTSVFDPGITDFYGWIIPKDGEIAFGAALPVGPDASAHFARLKEKLSNRGFDLSAPRRREVAMLLRPGWVGDLCYGSERVALVGEAAGFISPSSAEGLSFAMRSSRALATAIDGGLDGGLQRRYHLAAAGVRASVFGKRLKSPAMYVPEVRACVMRSGVGAMRPVTDDERGATSCPRPADCIGF